MRAEVLSGHKPRIGSTAKGAVWNRIPVILPDGTHIMGHLDMAYGTYIYFQIGSKWKKVSVTRIGSRWEVDLR